MKISILTLLAVLFINVNVFSQKQNLEHSFEMNAMGKPNTVISTDSKSHKPLIKTEYTYNANGKRESKTFYIWDSKKENWTKRHITKYFYNPEGQLLMASMTNWNNKENKWSKKYMNMVYNYNEEGNFLSVQHVKSEHIDIKHLASN